MAKTANITIRIDPETKANAEQLFSSFGITVTDAISIFLHKSIMEGGLPFAVKQPRFNAETETAIDEAGALLQEKHRQNVMVPLASCLMSWIRK